MRRSEIFLSSFLIVGEFRRNTRQRLFQPFNVLIYALENVGESQTTRNIPRAARKISKVVDFTIRSSLHNSVNEIVDDKSSSQVILVCSLAVLGEQTHLASVYCLCSLSVSVRVEKLWIRE
jgi:hypothetical protein